MHTLYFGDGVIIVYRIVVRLDATTVTGRTSSKQKMLEKLTHTVAFRNILVYNKLAGIVRRITMKTINERIKEYRNQLHLSQMYVASYLGINRATYTQMENGNRKITAEDISKLSTLFGVSADILVNNKEISQPATMFARSFEKLDEADQEEIMNLIRFKEQMKLQRNK